MYSGAYVVVFESCQKPYNDSARGDINQTICNAGDARTHQLLD